VAREVSRTEYAARYGPTTGDRIRLGDTNLLALIEREMHVGSREEGK